MSDKEVRTVPHILKKGSDHLVTRVVAIESVLTEYEASEQIDMLTSIIASRIYMMGDDGTMDVMKTFIDMVMSKSWQMQEIMSKLTIDPAKQN